MRGLGTIYNVAGILLGGTVGVLFGRRIKSRVQETLLRAVGVCVMVLGLAGCLEEMLLLIEEV